jgi:methionyl-tRNA synthetase
MDNIEIEDFAKIDLRVAKVINVETVEEADKLIKLELDIGEFGKKTVFAGIKKAYKNEELADKLVICVNNLKERKMRFGTSEGMILAAGDDESGIFIVSPQTGALPGMKVS